MAATANVPLMGLGNAVSSYQQITDFVDQDAAVFEYDEGEATDAAVAGDWTSVGYNATDYDDSSYEYDGVAVIYEDDAGVETEYTSELAPSEVYGQTQQHRLDSPVGKSLSRPNAAAHSPLAIASVLPETVSSPSGHKQAGEDESAQDLPEFEDVEEEVVEITSKEGHDEGAAPASPEQEGGNYTTTVAPEISEVYDVEETDYNGVASGEDYEVGGDDEESAAVEEPEEYVEEEGAEQMVDVDVESTGVEVDEENNEALAGGIDDLEEEGPLPCCILEYKTGFYTMFNVYEGGPAEQDILFGWPSEWEVLFQSPLTVLISELKSAFGIVNDVTMEFPQLNLSLPEAVPYTKEIPLRQLYEFHEAIQDSNSLSEKEREPLKIALYEARNSFERQFQYLQNLVSSAKDASEEPIVTDESRETSVVDDTIVIDSDDVHAHTAASSSASPDAATSATAPIITDQPVPHEADSEVYIVDEAEDEQAAEEYEAQEGEGEYEYAAAQEELQDEAEVNDGNDVEYVAAENIVADEEIVDYSNEAADESHEPVAFSDEPEVTSIVGEKRKSSVEPEQQLTEGEVHDQKRIRT
ncbi:hypothetical protein HK102_007352 [Quaeritorhiza haematococci]|nr:hypothetical protein HK102_007352 [Quaeritorhiza haematococci]